MIAIVDYHKGNLLSVERGLVGVGAGVVVTDEPDVIRAADAVVLPGVGAFADAAASMAELGQLEAVRGAVEGGAPFLGICLGMHLMFAAGTEHATDEGSLPCGLGFIEGVVDAMPRTDEAGRAYKVPHVGWNSVEFAEPNPLFEGIAPSEFFYFTHSYIAPPSAATIAETVHSVTFPCAVQVPGRPVFGVQFHPEKSSEAGARLLANFATIAATSRSGAAFADKVAESAAASKE
ncbi:imidazole glycerol phosphate synthase subunit HisH [Adlercreutzia shanghongiae]|uniref:Imidazole glycerol phosphate synthase subunit HisH n=1 Tax=Adlercreutzia shanghongiae TaxID=3111773 RepID=A0ABU6J0I2_9ACTN|nr:imidazole glycerol phosphate synthase subunit HisH [Adlercreutzia sp. R22]MEC4295578.1 imidazole glycerol phosphate synthase subunit HisH [Adlercreutzia sp. R22]